MNTIFIRSVEKDTIYLMKKLTNNIKWRTADKERDYRKEYERSMVQMLKTGGEKLEEYINMIVRKVWQEEIMPNR